MEEIIDSYLFCLDKKISEAPFNKDEKAKIIAKNNNNTYDILMNGLEYHNIKCNDTTYDINKLVTVVIPKNNYNEMYIVSETSGGGSSGGGGDLSIEIVETLPTTDISINTIYLVPKTSVALNNAYSEYIYIENAWEKIGDTSIDTDDFYDKSAINQLLLSKLDTDFANIEYADVNVANINSLFAKDGIVFNLTADNVTIDDAVIGEIISPKITALDLTSGSILTTDFTIQSSSSTNSGLKIYDNTMQFYNSDGEVGIQLGYGTSTNPSLIIKDENGSIMLDSDGLHDNIVPDGFIKEEMVGDGEITDEKINWSTTANVKDDDGNALWLTSSQVLTSTEFTTKFDEIKDTTDGIETRTSSIELTLDGLNTTVSETVIKSNNAYVSLYDEYATNQDSENAPTTGWSSIPPEWQSGYYMWRRTVSTKGNGDVSTSTPVNISGSKGDTGLTGLSGADGLDGIDGVDGTNGVNGITYYIWIKYANSATPSSSDMSDAPDGKAYMGFSSGNISPTPSDNPDDYMWSKIQGEDGVGVSSIVAQYYLSDSKLVQTGGEWIEDGESIVWEEGKYLWHRSKITYTDGNIEYVGLYVDTAWESSTALYDGFLAITEDLQTQVDGEISSWFYDGTPTLSNLPASEWITDAAKNRHIGDTYTNTEAVETSDTAGQSFRFVNENSVYKWEKISDNDVLLALERASDAQESADGKITYFDSQPSNYHKGDIWILKDDFEDYTIGDMLNASQDSSIFVSSHWSKELKYTDDSLTIPLIEQNTSTIEQTQENILLEVSTNYVLGEEFEEYKSTSLDITNDAITFAFNSIKGELSGDINDVENQLDEYKEDNRKFIEFADGIIRLGESNNAFQTLLSNTKISFTQNGEEVAYLSNHTLYIQRAHFLDKYTLGNESDGYYSTTIDTNGRINEEYTEVI